MRKMKHNRMKTDRSANVIVNWYAITGDLNQFDRYEMKINKPLKIKVIQKLTHLSRVFALSSGSLY